MSLDIYHGSDRVVAGSGSIVVASAGSILITTPAGEITAIADDRVLALGTDGDGALVNRSTILGANTALTDVLVGTPASAASPANSVLLSNITADGDVVLFTRNAAGADSIEMLRLDASAGLTVFNEAGADVDFRIESDTNANMLVMDAGVNVVAIGGVIATNALLRVVSPATSGGTRTLVIVPGAHTAVTAEQIGINAEAYTITVTGAYSNQRFVVFDQPTISAASALTVTEAYGVVIGIPTVASSARITESAALQLGFNPTVNNVAGSIVGYLMVGAQTVTLSQTTQITSSPAVSAVRLGSFTVNQSGGAVTVDNVSTLYVAGAMTAGASVTLTNNYSIWSDAGIIRSDGSIIIGVAAASALPAAGLYSTGGVMIGANSTNNLIDDASNGAATTTLYIGNASINVTSDMRLKTDIHKWDGSALDVLGRAPRLVEFTWDDPSDRNPWGRNSRGPYKGWLAQETIDWAPWIVNAGSGKDCPLCRSGEACSEHGYWQVEYEHLVPLLVKGIQELRDRVISLELAMIKWQ